MPGESVTFTINHPMLPGPIADLRAAVGWGRWEEGLLIALPRYWATVSGWDAAGHLVAWCAILSDGDLHAFLLDVIVHPTRQREGIGAALVATALAHIREHHLEIVHVDFAPEHRTFYEQCGFRPTLAGLIELRY